MGHWLSHTHHYQHHLEDTPHQQCLQRQANCNDVMITSSQLTGLTDLLELLSTNYNDIGMIYGQTRLTGFENWFYSRCTGQSAVLPPAHSVRLWREGMQLPFAHLLSSASLPLSPLSLSVSLCLSLLQLSGILSLASDSSAASTLSHIVEG